MMASGPEQEPARHVPGGNALSVPPAESGGADDVLAAIASAWGQVMPGRSLDPDKSWSALGLDSLKSLKIVLALEEALGRSIPLDAVHRDMRPRDVARALAAGERALAGDAAPDKTRLFLLPGLLGDEPVLADLRHALADAVSFEMVALPGLAERFDVLTSASDMGTRAADEIARRQPEGELLIAGFSFGGMVAYQAAQVLRARGRTVALLVLLDTFLRFDLAVNARMPAIEGLPVHRRLGARRRPGESLRGYGGRVVFAVLTRLHALRALHWYVRAQSGADAIDVHRRHVLGRLGHRALLGWRPQPYPGRIFLIQTDEGAAQGPSADWRALGSELRIAHLPGRHHGLLRGQLAATAALVRTALDDRAADRERWIGQE